MTTYTAQINCSVRQYLDLTIEAETEDAAEAIAQEAINAIILGVSVDSIAGISDSGTSDGDGCLYDPELECVELANDQTDADDEEG